MFSILNLLASETVQTGSRRIGTGCVGVVVVVWQACLLPLC